MIQVDGSYNVERHRETVNGVVDFEKACKESQRRAPRRRTLQALHPVPDVLD